MTPKQVAIHAHQLLPNGNLHKKYFWLLRRKGKYLLEEKTKYCTIYHNLQFLIYHWEHIQRKKGLRLLKFSSHFKNFFWKIYSYLHRRTREWLWPKAMLIGSSFLFIKTSSVGSSSLSREDVIPHCKYELFPQKNMDLMSISYILRWFML